MPSLTEAPQPLIEVLWQRGRYRLCRRPGAAWGWEEACRELPGWYWIPLPPVTVLDRYVREMTVLQQGALQAVA